MSADLLRRAAETLRQHAQAASDGRWWAGDEVDGRFLGNYGDFGWVVSGPAGSPEFEDSELGLSDARYVALMSPPVALALADLIEVALPYADLRDPGKFPIYVYAIKVARAVLRESTP